MYCAPFTVKAKNSGCQCFSSSSSWMECSRNLQCLLFS